MRNFSEYFGLILGGGVFARHRGSPVDLRGMAFNVAGLTAAPPRSATGQRVQRWGKASGDGRLSRQLR